MTPGTSDSLAGETTGHNESAERQCGGGRVRQRRLLRYSGRLTAHAKLLDRILRGTSDSNVGFDPLCDLLRRLGFRERIRGDHHIFTKDGVTEILNVQPRGHHAKAYQVQQVRKVILQHKLGGESDAE